MHLSPDFNSFLKGFQQVALILLDQRDRVVHLNDKAKRLLNKSESSTLGQSVYSLLPLETLQIPRSRRGLDKPATEILSLSGGYYEIEAGLLENGSSTSYVWLTLRSTNHLEEHKDLLGVLQQQKDLNKQLQMVLENSKDGIWVTDGLGKILSINPAAASLNGVRQEDLVGKKIQKIVELGIVDVSVVQEVLKQKREVSLKQYVKKTNKHLLVTGTPAFNKDNRISLVVVNERDVTDLDQMRSDLENAKKARQKAQEELFEVTMQELQNNNIIAESREMRQALATAHRIGRMEVSNILIQGESGVGKGLMAKFIHNVSTRKDKPFIQINCATLPANLFEAELFGYERGAFTGANESGKIGLIELAQDGTFLFDEIGELPLEIQAKLLKCLEDKEFYALGGSRPRQINCVVMYATNCDLEFLVRENRFRKDLYYRLNSIQIKVPPLRDRPEDILELAAVNLDFYNKKYNKSKKFSNRGLNMLLSYEYPGNVRELLSLLKKAVILSEDKILDDFWGEMLGITGKSAMDVSEGFSLPEKVAALERNWLCKALGVCGSTREMARVLGISQPTVVRKMKRYGLNNFDAKTNQLE